MSKGRHAVGSRPLLNRLPLVTPQRKPRPPMLTFLFVFSLIAAVFVSPLAVLAKALPHGAGEQSSMSTSARQPAETSVPAPAAMAVVPTPEASAPEIVDEHVVQKGERFIAIVAARGIEDWQAEAQRIGLNCPHRLATGQIIKFAPNANAAAPNCRTSKAQHLTDRPVAHPMSMDLADAQPQVALMAFATASPKMSSAAVRKKAVTNALAQRGDPYLWGAAGPNAFDCSGLVKYSFAAAGKSLPRNSRAQAEVGVSVSKSNLQPGDLVFFYKPISHVGIYIGDGKIVHASRKGQPVKISDMKNMPFSGARRV